MRIDISYSRSEGQKFLDEMINRYKKVISLGTPLWIYRKEGVMRSAEFALVSEYTQTKEGIESDQFFICRNVNGSNWWINIPHHQITHTYPSPNKNYDYWLNQLGCVSNEMPEEFKPLVHSFIRQLFEYDWQESYGLPVSS